MLYNTYPYKAFLHVNFMPTITCYLNLELYDYVENSPSKIIQEALHDLINKKLNSDADKS